jgi:hypothetical protein
LLSVTPLSTCPPLAVRATCAPLIGIPKMSTSLSWTRRLDGVPEVGDDADGAVVELVVLVDVLGVSVVIEVATEVTVIVVVDGGEEAALVVALVAELVGAVDEVVVEWEVVVVVVEVVADELVVDVELIDVLVVVVVVIEGDTVKTMFVLPIRVKVAVPPPPFALVLAKVPTFTPTTLYVPLSSIVRL